jgi:hypothetical protein
VLDILRNAETTQNEIARLNFSLGRGEAQRANAVARETKIACRLIFRSCSKGVLMPYVRLDLPRAYARAVKRDLATRFCKLYAEVMQTQSWPKRRYR